MTFGIIMTFGIMTFAMIGMSIMTFGMISFYWRYFLHMDR